MCVFFMFIDEVDVDVFCMHGGPCRNRNFKEFFCVFCFSHRQQSRYRILPEDHGRWSLHLRCLQQGSCGNYDVAGLCIDGRGLK